MTPDSQKRDADYGGTGPHDHDPPGFPDNYDRPPQARKSGHDHAARKSGHAARHLASGLNRPYYDYLPAPWPSVRPNPPAGLPPLMKWPKPWSGNKDTRCDPPRVLHDFGEYPVMRNDGSEYWSCNNCSLTVRVDSGIAEKAEAWVNRGN